MILIVDEIVNASADHLVSVSGFLFNWFDIYNDIANQGPRAWEATPPFLQSLTPAEGGAGARPWQERWPNFHIENPTPVFWAAPTNYGWEPYKVGLLSTTTQHGAPICIRIYREDQTSLFCMLQIMSYENKVEAKDPPESWMLRITENSFIGGLNAYRGPEYSDLVKGHALVLMSWQLPARTDNDPADQLMHPVFPLKRPFLPEDAPPEWPAPHTHTVLLADRSPVGEFLFEQDLRPTPTSPMLHLGLTVTDTVLINVRGTYDFSGAPAAYAANVLAGRYGALLDWRKLLFETMRFIVKEATPTPIGYILNRCIDEAEQSEKM